MTKIDRKTQKISLKKKNTKTLIFLFYQNQLRIAKKIFSITLMEESFIRQVF